MVSMASINAPELRDVVKNLSLNIHEIDRQHLLAT